jgi:hypothetical protein
MLSYSKDLWNDLIEKISSIGCLKSELLPIVYHFVTSRHFLEKITTTQCCAKHCNISVKLYKILVPSYASSSQFHSLFSSKIRYFYIKKKKRNGYNQHTFSDDLNNQKSLTFCYMKKSCIIESWKQMATNISRLQQFNIVLPLYFSDTLKKLTQFKFTMLPLPSIECQPGQSIFKIRLRTQKV